MAVSKARSVFKKVYKDVTESIAFFPALIAIAGLVLSFVIMSIEYDSFIIELKDRISSLLITNRSEAQLVLGTLIASIISLMVFSFSMVMVVLGRASTNLSPRVLPGLISNKTHQIVLGVYLGTIIYSLIIVINFQAEGDYRIPSLGVLLAMIFGIVCLSLFVYFIHSISQSIQVENIIERIYNDTLNALKKQNSKEVQDESDIEKQGEWKDVLMEKSGYIKSLDSKALVAIAEKHDLQIEIKKYLGFYIVEKYPFVRIISDKEIPDEALEEVRNSFMFFANEQIEDHYLFGFRQISEIAVKALSPGINDPGTALKAIDHLTTLFMRKMELNELRYKRDNDGTVRLVFSVVSFEELLFQVLVPIREYGRRDVTVAIKLLILMKNLIYFDKESGKHVTTLAKMTRSIIESADQNLDNTLDRKEVNQVIEMINKLLPDNKLLNTLG